MGEGFATVGPGSKKNVPIVVSIEVGCAATPQRGETWRGAAPHHCRIPEAQFASDLQLTAGRGIVAQSSKLCLPQERG